MTQDEILAAAKEAGLRTGGNGYFAVSHKTELEAFAKNIERKTIERCAVVAEESTCECCWSEEARDASNECAAAIRKLEEK